MCGFHRLRPRVLVDVSKINMSTSLLGYDMPSPIIVAPTGSHKLANPEGIELLI
jgi:(S)-2-hydroxy-acid oxidase